MNYNDVFVKEEEGMKEEKKCGISLRTGRT
jgi:hypothetical protein